jgi:Domain of Unknown Function (DUF928)
MRCPTRAQIDFDAYLLEPRLPEWEAFRLHLPTCPECAAELAQWSEIESRLRVAAAPEESIHPSEERLLSLQEDPAALTPEERASLDEHLAICVVCRDALSAIATLDVPKSRAGMPGRAAPSRGRLLVFRRRLPQLAAAAALVGLLSLGWLLWSQRSVPIAPQPEPQIVAAEPTPSGRPQDAAPEQQPDEAPIAVSPERPREEPPVVTQTGAPKALAPAPTKPEPPRVAERPKTPPGPHPPAEPKAAEKTPDARPGRALVVAAVAASQPLVYVAPLHAAPSMRVGGGTRSAIPNLPTVLAFAPEHEGFTVSASPTLHWFLSQQSAVPCQLVLSDPNREEPILELTIPPPVQAGIHTVDLAKRGIVLQPGIRYRWFASLVPDATRRSSDVISGGVIQRVALDGHLQKALAEADHSLLGQTYARNGLFYDALAFLSKAIDEAPNEPRLRELRASLLEQVGLPEAARYARSSNARDTRP